MRTEAMAEIEASLENRPAETLEEQPEQQPTLTPETPIEPAPLVQPGGQSGFSWRPIWNGITTRLGSLPQPGSLAVPLILLLAFFFLLIPVNGKTRAVWLWLVLTGNAEIGQGVGGGGEPPAPVAQTNPAGLTNVYTFPTSYGQEIS